MGGAFEVRVTLIIGGETETEMSLRRVPSVGEKIGVLSTEGASVSTRVYAVHAIERREEKVFVHVYEVGAPP